MQFKLKTFNVGAGDCIILLLQNNDKEIHILIDCGNYTPEVNDYVVKNFHDHIDYLIVTHIDNDHINGLIEMLTSKPDLTINHILYNCYQRTSDDLKNWDENMVANVRRVYGHLPIVVDLLEGKIDAKASKTLAELILENENWKKAWQMEYVTIDTPTIDLGDDMGHFIFLSPTNEALDVLDKEYRLLFWKTLYMPKKLDYDKEETIYEALMRVMEQEYDEEPKEGPVSSKVFGENT